MENKNTDVKAKLEAIQTIVDLLDGFPSEDVKDIVSFSLKQLKLDDVAFDEIQDSTPTEGPKARADSTNGSIYDYVREKGPKNEYQRVAVLAHYLEKNRNMESVTARDVVDANTEARQPRFSNISTTMNRSSGVYKYINSLSRGVYQLSATGLDLVNALPDQSAIPKMKGSKSSSKSKK